MDAYTHDVVLTALFLRLKSLNDFLSGVDLSNPFYDPYIAENESLREYICEFRALKVDLDLA